MTGVNADNYMDYLGAYDASAVDVTPANILYRPAGNCYKKTKSSSNDNL